MAESSNQLEMFADGGWFRMSNSIIDKIPEIGTAAASTYMVLARFADDEGVCFPSTSKIAAALGMTSRAARLSIARLEEAGLIMVERRPQMAQKNLSNLFRLLPLSPQGQAERDFRSPQSDRNEISPTGGTRFQGVGERDFIHKKTQVKKTHSKKTNRALRFDADDMKLVKWMWKLVEVIPGNEDDEPDLEEWANEIRISRERDGKPKGTRTHKELCTVFKWANEDDFWRGKILTPKKLREKFDQLNIDRLSQKGKKMENHKTSTNQESSPTPENTKAWATPEWPPFAPQPRILTGLNRSLGLVDPDLVNVFRDLTEGRRPWPLFLHGKVGTGKTRAALALCDYFQRSAYFTVDDLCDIVMGENGDAKYFLWY